MKPRYKLNGDGSTSLLCCDFSYVQALAAQRRAYGSTVSAKLAFEEAGVSLADWCRAHNLPYDVARHVISGRLKARRGAAHRIAVALAIKPAANHIRFLAQGTTQ